MLVKMEKFVLLQNLMTYCYNYYAILQLHCKKITVIDSVKLQILMQNSNTAPLLCKFTVIDFVKLQTITVKILNIHFTVKLQVKKKKKFLTVDYVDPGRKIRRWETPLAVINRR